MILQRHLTYLRQRVPCAFFSHKLPTVWSLELTSRLWLSIHADQVHREMSVTIGASCRACMRLVKDFFQGCNEAKAASLSYHVSDLSVKRREIEESMSLGLIELQV